MKDRINRWISEFIAEYSKQSEISTEWGEPIVGFADAYSPYIQNLPGAYQQLPRRPQDIMEDAASVIAYFVPFTRALAKSNNNAGEYASQQWADAYEQTNAMFAD